MKGYRVALTAEERESLRERAAAGKAAAGEPAHARISPQADPAEGGPAWPDSDLDSDRDLGLSPVARVRQRFAGQGPDAAPGRKPQHRPGRPRKPGAAAEARLIAVACSAPPSGRADWTVPRPADPLAERKAADSVSDETARRVLQKPNPSRGRRSRGAPRLRPTPGSWRRRRTCGRSLTAPPVRSGRRSAATRPAGR